MLLPRRDFLRLMGGAAGATAVGSCGKLWRVPDKLVELAQRGPGIESHLNTVCGLCEGGCGMTVRLVDDLPVGLKGNPQHPLNRGGLCPVGHAGLDVLYSPQPSHVQPLRRNGPTASCEPTRPGRKRFAEITSRLAELRTAERRRHRIALLSGEPDLLFGDQLAARFAAGAGLEQHRGGRGDLASPSVPAHPRHRPNPRLRPCRLRPRPLLRPRSVRGRPGTACTRSPRWSAAAPTVDARGAVVHIGTRLSPSAARAEERVLGDAPAPHGAVRSRNRPGPGARGALRRCASSASTPSGFEDWTDGDGQPARLSAPAARALLPRPGGTALWLRAGC